METLKSNRIKDIAHAMFESCKERDRECRDYPEQNLDTMSHSFCEVTVEDGVDIEFRADISAEYRNEDDTYWTPGGSWLTWISIDLTELKVWVFDEDEDDYTEAFLTDEDTEAIKGRLSELCEKFNRYERGSYYMKKGA